MPCLIIDNYDSYTHILANIVWKISGEEPLIFKNDEITQKEIEALDFDRIIISPGPGRADNPGDFGICRALIKKYRHLPLLGVCLGHQGMALLAGAELEYLPEVTHGVVSPIEHYGDPIFKAVPKHFEGTRYHSMVVKVPPEEGLLNSNRKIKILAKSKDDGQIMAIRIENTNHYGVQFHPESVGTPHGEIILSNFLNINRKILKLNTLKEFNKAKKRELSLQLEPLPWREPSEVAQHFFSEAENFFWLDSNDDNPSSEWSFMGAPRRVFCKGENALEFLCEELRNWGGEAPEFPFPFKGGFVFLLPFDWNGSNFGREPNKEVGAKIFQVDSYFAFHHTQKKVYWVRLPKFAKAMTLDSEICPEITFSLMHEKVVEWFSWGHIRNSSPNPEEVEEHWKNPEVAWNSAMDRCTYLKVIQKAKELIRLGESYEICLSNQWSAELNLNPLDVYFQLRRVNPAPFSAFFKWDGESVLSSSPERFLNLKNHGQITTEPIKGTRRKEGDGGEGERLKNELLQNPKEGAELLMITDLLRNDLAKVCEPGTVQVKSLKKLTSYATVYQLSSEILGQLRSSLGPADLLKACFPGGSITGAPKRRSIEIIRSLELFNRSYFTGTLGYLSLDGTLDSNILIRCLFQRENRWVLGAGGAILSLSDPEKEWEEIKIKAEPMMRAVERAVNRHRMILKEKI